MSDDELLARLKAEAERRGYTVNLFREEELSEAASRVILHGIHGDGGAVQLLMTAAESVPGFNATFNEVVRNMWGPAKKTS